MRTDRQTDVTKLTAAFRNFANTPKIKKKLTAAKAFNRPRLMTVNSCVLITRCFVCEGRTEAVFSVLLPAREFETQQLQDFFL